MRTNRRQRWLGGVLVIAVLAGPDVAAGEFGGGRKWAVGVGAATSPSPFVAEQVEVLPLPILLYDGPRLRLTGMGAGLRLVRNRRYAVELLARYRFEGFDPDGNERLAGMDRRNGAVEGGLSATLQSVGWRLTASVHADVIGTHDGVQTDLQVSREWLPAKWIVTPRAGLRIRSGDLVDYYYGVRGAEANASRVSYRGSTAFNGMAGLDVVRVLGTRWFLAAGVDVEQLDSGIRDSPIVDDGIAASSYAALFYAF